MAAAKPLATFLMISLLVGLAHRPRISSLKTSLASRSPPCMKAAFSFSWVMVVVGFVGLITATLLRGQNQPPPLFQRLRGHFQKIVSLRDFFIYIYIHNLRVEIASSIS